MKKTAAVAMFCGPHDQGDQPPTRRIDHAIEIARRLETMLFIAGDAFNGTEISYFQQRAWSAGVGSVIRAFDSRHCTLSDAQAVADQIIRNNFRSLSQIHLVTDWWHMDRAREMLEGELWSRTGRKISVTPEPVRTGPRPSELVHQNEHQGLLDYKAGNYGRRRVNDPLRHC